MTPYTWVVATSVISSLGSTSEENYEKVRREISGLSQFEDPALLSRPICAAQLCEFTDTPADTRFELMCRKAAKVALAKTVVNPERTLYILSTTKGNVALLDRSIMDPGKLSIHSTARKLAAEIGLSQSIAVSNACISGVLAIIVGKRLLNSGKYDHIIIVGADTLSQFVVSGFDSLQALSDEPCKPFDTRRKGINLGEAAAAIILSNKSNNLGTGPSVCITGSGLSNDANHISGPSRTGMELGLAIQQALEEAGKSPENIDFISAHGTATLFNDEMEAKALYHQGLMNVPVHSLKGYFGHTLGAAGVLESIMCVESLMHNEILASMGFQEPGVSTPIHVSRELTRKSIATSLKTASGFGGCNAAIVLQKVL